MPRLSEFRVDARAISDGAWVRVDDTRYGDLEILTRGWTDDFIDANKARTKKAAQRYGGDADRIPNAEMREINADLLRMYLVLDVRNLEDDDGRVISVKEFHLLLSDQSYGQLARACWDAAQRVSTMSIEQLEHSEKNSPRPSASSSNGQSHQALESK